MKPKKIKIYYSHAMSGLSEAKSIRRAEKFEKLLKKKIKNIDIRIPERWQNQVKHHTICDRDLTEVRQSKYMILDTQFIGSIVGNAVIISRGTWEESGYAKAAGVPIIEIGTGVHPFACGSKVIVQTVEEAVEKIVEMENAK